VLNIQTLRHDIEREGDKAVRKGRGRLRGEERRVNAGAC
jgi:hypothetical protein